MSALLALLAVLATAPTPPAPSRWVEDRASFLSPPTRVALDLRLEGYERSTGHQVVVWIDDTLQGAPLDDWAVRTFAAWKLGRKGVDDGIALFVFADDRAIDIEVGYGLEDKVPDAIASRIIHETMAPRLQAGDRDGAVTAGVDAVLGAIEGRPWTAQPAVSVAQPTSWITWGLYGVLAVLALIFLIKYPRAATWLLWSLVSGGRGGGGGRAGFGGHGGRSGGGGARGGW
jgi:uncharacterized protein